jgi:hypothetical protein
MTSSVDTVSSATPTTATDSIVSDLSAWHPDKAERDTWIAENIAEFGPPLYARASEAAARLAWNAGWRRGRCAEAGVAYPPPRLLPAPVDEHEFGELARASGRKPALDQRVENGLVPWFGAIVPSFTANGWGVEIVVASVAGRWDPGPVGRGSVHGEPADAHELRSRIAATMFVADVFERVGASVPTAAELERTVDLAWRVVSMIEDALEASNKLTLLRWLVTFGNYKAVTMSAAAAIAARARHPALAYLAPFEIGPLVRLPIGGGPSDACPHCTSPLVRPTGHRWQVEQILALLDTAAVSEGQATHALGTDRLTTRKMLDAYRNTPPICLSCGWCPHPGELPSSISPGTLEIGSGGVDLGDIREEIEHLRCLAANAREQGDVVHADAYDGAANRLAHSIGDVADLGGLG